MEPHDLLGRCLHYLGFNPPGGFGAFGTLKHNSINPCAKIEFQSAGRIWGFWNPIWHYILIIFIEKFQSAGRIWGFWNYADAGAPL